MMQRLITIFMLLLIAYSHAEEPGTNREVRSLSTDSIQLGLKSLITNSLGNLEPIITFLKTQIRDIIIDLGIQAFKYIVKILYDCKVRFLKKLGMVTIADIFHLIFDGVLELITENGSGITQDDGVLETSDYETEYALPNPYSLENLILSGDNK
ncbi:uncharacterized protein LOC123870518 [Maniola jurtina]|uniref:uncharacterized protein LOC123870518 n=1 Tax=Maniola jurtina TaxID=191418 RepID=UPI001E68C952|nr:uncharacterized protein LOC123870518 [Maniola jurtina]